MIHSFFVRSHVRNVKRGFSSTNQFNSPLAWYKQKLETDPLKTKALTSGFIAGLGDFNCQYLVHDDKTKSKFSPDWIRTLRFFALGTFLVAPVVHHWYGFLAVRIPGNSTQSVIKRTIIDQFLFAPAFCVTFMSSLMTMEGKDFHFIQNTVARDLSDVMIANWCLWIPAQLINFRCVPLQWQVLYSNSIAFIWNTYLSWKTQETNTIYN